MASSGASSSPFRYAKFPSPSCPSASWVTASNRSPLCDRVGGADSSGVSNVRESLLKWLRKKGWMEGRVAEPNPRGVDIELSWEAEGLGWDMAHWPTRVVELASWAAIMTVSSWTLLVTVMTIPNSSYDLYWLQGWPELHAVLCYFQKFYGYSRQGQLTSTPAIDLNKNIALGKLPKRSLAPVRKPLPREKFRNENLLWARFKHWVSKCTKNATLSQRRIPIKHCYKLTSNAFFFILTDPAP